MALHKLSEGERKIFEKVRITDNPNWFSDFYLRGENTGTWWNPDAITKKWMSGYTTLYTIWEQEGKKKTFQYGHEGKEATYRAVFLDGGYEGEKPAFHHLHGFLFQPWQLDVYQAEQRIRTIFGGYGCGKTLGGIVGMLVRCATLPGYRGIVLAPNSTMTQAIYNEALTVMEDTLFKERFFIRSRESPFPEIKIGNDEVGANNYIKFFPIGDHRGAKKILTLTVDEFFIDQAEQLEGIQDIIRMCGSRMRGMHQGRPRLGRITFSANADENEELWDLFDDAKKDPDRYASFQVKTWDNPFITDKQIIDIKKDVGGDDESIRVHMEGGRPVTGGEHFSAETLLKCKSDYLNEQMKIAIKTKLDGHVYTKMEKIGVTEWALPPRKGRNYLVVADPGYSNPPQRNSPVIMVFDYTDFPQQPAMLWGFFWVFGNNSPEPWLQKYEECVIKYSAHMSNAFDATGPQAGYERLVPELNKIHAHGMSLGGNTKFVFLNHTKRMTARGLFAFPRINGVFQQLSRYRLPDTKLKQDIVSALLIAGGWLESVFFTGDNHEDEPNEVDRLNRNDRPKSRGDRGNSRRGRSNRSNSRRSR